MISIGVVAAATAKVAEIDFSYIEYMVVSHPLVGVVDKQTLQDERT
jgi:hypothetical protein